MKRLVAVLLICGSLSAQEKRVPNVVPVPPMPRSTGPRVVPEPTSPPPQNFVDPRTHVYFHLGPGWRLSRKDGELSTFRQDARTAPRSAQLKAVAMLAFNPYPQSTFSGAMLYLSTIPHATGEACEGQAKLKPGRVLPPLPIAQVPFARGLDEHGKICPETRDVTYVATHEGTCVRFDLAVHTFCGGEVSGATDMTDVQLANVFRRLESILDTVDFNGGERPTSAASR